MHKYLIAILISLVGTAGVMASKPFIAVLGDSNSWLGGDGCDSPKGWTFYLREILQDAELRSYARSGATWSHTERTGRDSEEYSEIISDNNVILNQFLRLHQDVQASLCPSPDIIILAAGTNDAWFESKYRPGCMAEDDSLSPLTVEGAVRFGLNVVRGLYPEAYLLILTPMESTVVADASIKTVARRIENGCHNFERTTVLRMDTLSPVRSTSERRCLQYTYDGTHTSIAGAKANAQIVADFLKNNKIIHRY